MSFLRKYFFHSPVHYGVALGLNIFFVLLVLALNGFDRLLYYVDAFSVAGALSVLFGLLLWVSSAGAFNTFAYAFSTLRAERKYKDLFEYTAAKEERTAKQKKIQVPYMVIGVVFLVVSMILAERLVLI